MRKVEWHFWTLGQYRQEEQWLNKKAEEGWALISAFAVRYEFEPCTPGEYTYKIMFTDYMPGTEGRQNFESFLAENGIEEVGRYHRWAYYRKKNDGTPFELFNSTAEELKHANKIKSLASMVMTIITICLVIELICFLHNPLILLPALIIVATGFAFVAKVHSDCVKLVKELERENRLFE
ncbi:MAG: DUF2812 domain-containing protein [Oscillospiraceae bacterium]|nr:DUF2812 domain-containing protein [Oscillospiraceae bacterium]MBQ6850786.1 DUF2812 domain-containing protein [Oscillospiraceae bacterium]MBR6610392.1 DUF2812 domain-containing protein [Oscillospiraceae bacterium]